MMAGEKEAGKRAVKQIKQMAVVGTTHQFRAVMQRLENLWGGSWTAPTGEILKFSEKRKIVTLYDTDGSIPWGMGGKITGTRQEDKTPPGRASWVVSSSRLMTKEEQESRAPAIREEFGDGKENDSQFLERLKRKAGVEVYEVRENRIQVDFLDAYEPYGRTSATLLFPIGSAFVEFSKVVLEEMNFENSAALEISTELETTDLPAMLSATPFLSQGDVLAAHRMSELYVVLHCYENSVRRFIETVLSDELGVDWWDEAASAAMKGFLEGRKKQEEKKKWLSPRGGVSPLYYLEWGDLEKLIRKYEHLFLPYIGELRFVESRFGDLESLRNIVAHHGILPSDDDFERVKLSFRDWCRQVGNREVNGGGDAA